MATTLVIALIAGCTSAVMFASIISGVLFSLVLFYLAPLPLFVAALGWGPLAAFAGSAIGGIGLGVIFGPAYFVVFMISVAAPACWLGHLMLLAKPLTGDASTAPASPEALQWYPTGRLLLWIAVCACVITACVMLTLGTDDASIRAALRAGLTRALGRAADTIENADRALDLLTDIAPAAATIMAMATFSINVWIATKVVAMSGRLRRPWPDLRSIELPKGALIATVAALTLSFAGGTVGLLSQLAAAALMMAFTITGFAVLHIITQAMTSRRIWLTAAYASVFVFGWPAVAVAALGMADTIVGFRQRLKAGHPPVPQHPHT